MTASLSDNGGTYNNGHAHEIDVIVNALTSNAEITTSTPIAAGAIETDAANRCAPAKEDPLVLACRPSLDDHGNGSLTFSFRRVAGATSATRYAMHLASPDASIKASPQITNPAGNALQ